MFNGKLKLRDKMQQSQGMYAATGHGEGMPEDHAAAQKETTEQGWSNP